MEHAWKPYATNADYIQLDGAKRSLVRIKPMPDGRYLWQFRKVASYAPTLEQAKEYVEAGAEYFEVTRRNPYQD